jgi:hypothetical protein
MAGWEKNYVKDFCIAVRGFGNSVLDVSPRN